MNTYTYTELMNPPERENKHKYLKDSSVHSRVESTKCVRYYLKSSKIKERGQA